MIVYINFQFQNMKPWNKYIKGFSEYIVCINHRGKNILDTFLFEVEYDIIQCWVNLSLSNIWD